MNVCRLVGVFCASGLGTIASQGPVFPSPAVLCRRQVGAVTDPATGDVIAKVARFGAAAAIVISRSGSMLGFSQNDCR